MFITGVAEAEADGEVAEYYETQRGIWGFLPNYAASFSHRPGVAAAWQTLNLAIRGGMDRRRYEIVTIAAARARRSTACTAAHSKFLRDACDDDATMRAISERPDGANLGELDRALYEFATAVATDAAAIRRADVERLRALGLSDTDIADVVFAVAARCFFTAVLDGTGVQLDPETAAEFEPELLASMIVGRPVAGT
ncbi:carboxymuconolactone decarboxylase family protein [Agromyces italicus]|uniref:carboxymuconolactone decarboxylase family protein n=1 Tax=Agromyces italicus TaxID=279572 RepID=UPI0003B33C37|nr:carboxymuconolactone decarboxylase family protein [Agromyces italicus]